MAATNTPRTTANAVDRLIAACPHRGLPESSRPQSRTCAGDSLLLQVRLGLTDFATVGVGFLCQFDELPEIRRCLLTIAGCTGSLGRSPESTVTVGAGLESGFIFGQCGRRLSHFQQ